ncbi:MAG: hypothetical protein INR73_02650 [Williamsia sp.]|nr:hypothetical protein [Williamsia sp.]
MLLLPPKIIGPVSECSKVIEVQDQLVGTYVKIYANNQIVAQGPASSTDQIFLLNLTLAATQKITATQEKDGVVSDHSPDPAIVQRKPSQLGHITFATPLFACGQALQVLGAVSGSEVQIRDGNNLIGKAFATGPKTRVELSQPLELNHTLKAAQISCSLTSAPSQLSVTENPPSVLPGVAIGRINECDPSFPVGNVIVGAHVQFYKNGATFGSAFFDVTAATVNSPSEGFFKAGDEVYAVQSMCKGKLQSSPDFQKVIVGRASAIGTPSLLGPVCVSAHFIKATGLKQNAIITVFQDGEELGSCQTPSPEYEIPIGRLRTGGKIFIRQSYCNRKSENSNTITVVADVGPAVNNVLHDPLYECSVGVFITNLVPGTALVVLSRQLGEISSRIFVSAAEMEVGISPALIAGDVIQVRLLKCGGGELLSNEITVKKIPVEAGSAPSIRPVAIDTPVLVSQSFLRVTRIVVGALLDVYVNGQWFKTVFGRTEMMSIYMPLVQNQRIKIIQRLCDLVSRNNPEVTVIWPKPKAPVLDYPRNGELNTELTPILDWHDPGSGDRFQSARIFFIYMAVVPHAENQIRSVDAGGSTQFRVDDLLPNTQYSWSVTSYNEGGEENSGSFLFTTGNAPVPRVLLAFDAPIFISDDGITMTNPVPNRPTSAYINIVNAGALKATGYKVHWTLIRDVIGSSDVTVKSELIVIPDLEQDRHTQSKFSVPALSSGDYRIEAEFRDSGGNLTPFLPALPYPFSLH